MAECKECLYYEVCADFRRNICETDKKRFEEYKINSNGICDRFEIKSDFQKVTRCKDCIKCIACQLYHYDDKRQFKDLMDYCSYGQRKEGE